MSKRGQPGMASGDTKSPSPLSLSKGHKQIGAENLPHRRALTQITGGDPFQRSMNNYAKQTPADADGAGAPGLNINTLAGG